LALSLAAPCAGWGLGVLPTPGAPGRSCAAVSMAVDGSARPASSLATAKGELDQKLQSSPDYVPVEQALAADIVNTLADHARTSQAMGELPRHDQLDSDPEAQARYDALLEESYEQCRKITAHYAKTFYFGTTFFDEPKRKAVWAVYAWCRRTDDIVDKPRKDSTSLRDELAEWTARLREIWQGKAYDSIDLALVDTVRNYPDLSVQPFEDMVKGMVMDLDQNRFDTFDELYVYCYRVAGTVGLMVLPIMGTAEDATFEEVRHASPSRPPRTPRLPPFAIDPFPTCSSCALLLLTRPHPASRRPSSPRSRSASRCSSPTSSATLARTARASASTCRARTCSASASRRRRCSRASRTRPT